jgi:hypothetical protein
MICGRPCKRPILFSCGGAQRGIPNWYPLVGIFSALVCSNLETCAEVVRGHLTGMGTSAYQWNFVIIIPLLFPLSSSQTPVCTIMP